MTNHKKITTKEFDRRFDEGEDISEFVDWSQGKRLHGGKRVAPGEEEWGGKPTPFAYTLRFTNVFGSEQTVRASPSPNTSRNWSEPGRNGKTERLEQLLQVFEGKNSVKSFQKAANLERFRFIGIPPFFFAAIA